MEFKRGFSLTEVLISVAIVGVLAAIAIPSIVADNDKYRWELGYKKAVNDVNNAISYNITNGKKSALATDDLVYYLQEAMNTVSFAPDGIRTSNNSEFYTRDGMRYEVPLGKDKYSDEFKSLTIGKDYDDDESGTSWTIKNSECGTGDLDIGGSTNAQSKQPCIILVDVNGNKGPNTLTDEEGTQVSDMFLIIVTDKNAIPYGALAQSVYYGEN